jgi:hypothetical protein
MKVTTRLGRSVAHVGSGCRLDEDGAGLCVIVHGEAGIRNRGWYGLIDEREQSDQ